MSLRYKFAYKKIDSLPRLAWCAVLQKDNPIIMLYHGPWVETREHCCFEGAWNGSFEAGGFDEADTFTGSGIRLTAAGVTFVTPSHPIEHLYVVRIGDQLVVSNSWVFLLVKINDQPDLAYANYFFDLRDNFRGIAQAPTKLRTQNDNQVSLYDTCNLAVTVDLAIRRLDKNRPAVPNTYDELAELFQTTVNQVIENATHPARKQRYRPVAMTSTGYDSPAVSSLFAKAGGTESVTFAWNHRNEPETGDDGSLIAQALGMSAKRFVRYAYTERTDLPEAEFCTASPHNWAPLTEMEETVAGSLLGTGFGGYLWQTESLAAKPSQKYIARVFFSYTSISEFRLRVGFCFFPVLHIGAMHTDAVHRIAQSKAMSPWVLPNTTYNMPIQRRLAEEGGVPRPLFGQQRHGSAHAHLNQKRSFSPTSLEDFHGFCAHHGLPTTRERSYLLGIVHRSSSQIAQISTRLLDLLPWKLYLHLMPYTWRLYSKSSHPLWRSPLLYTFHWGFARTKTRYAIAPATK